MSLDRRKIQLIHLISSTEDERIIDEVENIFRHTDMVQDFSHDDITAIEDGIQQLDRGDFLNRTDVRKKIKEKFNF